MDEGRGEGREEEIEVRKKGKRRDRREEREGREGKWSNPPRPSSISSSLRLKDGLKPGGLHGVKLMLIVAAGQQIWKV